MRMVTNTSLLCLQAACETFDVRGKQHIQIPKLYTSSATWEAQNYRLVQNSQSFLRHKGTPIPA
jgi:hypothetical protein